MRRIAAGAVVIAALGAGASCRDPTEIRLELTTDGPCAEMGETTVAVGGTFADVARGAPGASARACDDAATGRVGSIVLVPSGDRDAEVAVEVTLRPARDADCAATGARCIVARRRLHYLAHTRLTLPIALRAACAGVVCDVDRTCVAGVCAAAEVPDPGACVDPSACGESVLLDGGGGADAASEAGSSQTDAPPPNDATSTADAACTPITGAKPFSPGVIDCNGSPCPYNCCGPLSGGACMQGTCPAIRKCDEDADCAAGEWCCLMNVGGSVAEVCQASGCRYHACKSSCVCGGFTCMFDPACGEIATCNGACPLP